MFIRTLDQRLASQERFAPKQHFVCKSVQVAPLVPRTQKIYPLRVLARIFAFIGMATTVYATTLVGLFFQSGIIAF